MNSLYRWVRFIFLGLVQLLLFGSCESPKSSDGHKVFRYNETGTISSLDPAFATYISNTWAVGQMYNAPLEFDEKLQIKPSLAKKWEVLEDGKTYRLTLRDDVKFHDHKRFPNGVGRTCTAHDMEYSLKRICDTTGIYNKGIWIFKDKVLKDHRGMISDTCFKALNDTTLMIYLERPVPYFLQILCMPFCYVVPADLAAYYGKDFGRNPVGTGAFQFHSWDEGNALIMTKNPHYWKRDQAGKALPYLDALEVSFLSDVNQSFRAYQLGYFDFATRIGESVIDEVLYPDGSIRQEVSTLYDVVKAPYLSTDYLGFQLDSKAEVYTDSEKGSPFLNLDFRKALNYAVDRKRIITLLRNGLGLEGNHGFLPPAMPYFHSQNVKGYQFDQKLALEHLKASGFDPQKVKGLKLTVAKQYKELAEFLSKTWKEVLGVEVEIQMNEGKVCIDLAETGRISFFKMGWIADYPDGENFLTLFYGPNFSPSGPNRTHFKSSQFDALYRKAAKVNDPNQRGAIYEQMDAIMMEQSPIIVLNYDQILMLKNKNVKGLYLDPMNSLVLEGVDLIQ